MSSLRLIKVNQLIKKEVSKLLENEIEKELGLITVIDVETSPDLKHSYIWISIFNKDKLSQIVQRLKDTTPSLQKILNKRLTLKYVPRIIFKIDKSQDYVQKIDKLFKNIKNNSKSE